MNLQTQPSQSLPPEQMCARLWHAFRVHWDWDKHGTYSTRWLPIDDAIDLEIKLDSMEVSYATRYFDNHTRAMIRLTSEEAARIVLHQSAANDREPPQLHR